MTKSNETTELIILFAFYTNFDDCFSPAWNRPYAAVQCDVMRFSLDSFWSLQNHNSSSGRYKHQLKLTVLE